MKILYFARFRQIIGRGSDEIDLPANIENISALIDFLKGRDQRVADAFSDLRTLKVAINQSHTTLNASLAGATEVAFFPPVTGG